MLYYSVLYISIQLILLSLVSGGKIGSHALEFFYNGSDKLFVEDLKYFIYASSTQVELRQFVTLLQASLFKFDDVFLVHIEQGDLAFRVWQFGYNSHKYGICFLDDKWPNLTILRMVYTDV